MRDDVARTQSDRLSREVRDTKALFTTVGQGFAAVLTTGGIVAEVSHGNPKAFDDAVEPRLEQTLLSNAVLLRRRGDGFERLAWVGRTRPALLGHLGRGGEQILERVARSGQLFVVNRGSGANHDVLGIAAAPRTRSKYVVYAELSIPKAVAFGNLKGLDIAFYLGRVAPSRLFTSNTSQLPIRGPRVVTRIDLAGIGQRPLLVFGGMRTSTLSKVGPWLLLALGCLISLTLAGQYEAMRRRRNTALGLVADLEGKNDELDRQSALNRHQALHDALTGLPNRTLFHDRIEQAILQTRRHGGGAAVIMIDLDNFKEVNDSLGHVSGDILLQKIGARLSASTRTSDTVARVGGDEFGVLISGGVDHEDALAVATKLHGVLTQPVALDDLAVEVNASLGIALYPEHDDTPEALLRHADVALYRSKELHAPIVYSTEHDHYSANRLRLVTGLRSAIEDGDIVVHYQPEVLVGSGEVDAVEALVRWQHPEFGLIPPDQFIPLAQQTGVIRQVTRHVLTTALAQCRAWHDDDLRLRVAVNIGARDLLDESFAGEVLSILRATPADPAMLELEITEDTILTDPVRARAVIEELSSHGVQFAIDDFGTGQSSLAYLKRLPIHVLKVDRSFVLGMARNRDDAVIVRSIIELAHNLHLRVVAEGVETKEIQQQLMALGCDALQGYGVARPDTAPNLETLLVGARAARPQKAVVGACTLPEPA